MALRPIRRGPETVRLDVSQGAGWQPASRGIFDASVNNYPELATIQATGCTGLRVYDYDAPGQPYWESTTGTSHTLTVIKTARRLVARVENTTENTEVIMHVVPIPPPYFVGLLRAWWGACHGAKANRHIAELNRPHARRVNKPLGHMEHANRPVDKERDGQLWCHASPWAVSSGATRRNRPVLDHRQFNLDRHHQPGSGRRGHSACLLKQNASPKCNHHTPLLTSVGGGR